jgi:hypothetical protein
MIKAIAVVIATFMFCCTLLGMTLLIKFTSENESSEDKKNER